MRAGESGNPTKHVCGTLPDGRNAGALLEPAKDLEVNPHCRTGTTSVKSDFSIA